MFVRDLSPKSVVKSTEVNPLLGKLRQNRATTAVVSLVLVLAAVITWSLFSPRVDPRLDAIRQKGYPVTLSELNEWYHAVPDSENNGLIYEKVFPLLGSSGAPEMFGKLTSPAAQGSAAGRVLSVQDKKKLAELVATNAVVLRLLHSAQASNRCRYPIDMNKVFSPPHTGDNDFKVIEGVELLSVEALLHSANGDSQQAVRSFLAAGLLADSLFEKPLLTSQLVRFVCLCRIISGLERALTLTQMTDEQLALLQAMMAEAE